MLENGNLLRVGDDSIQIRDWDNNAIWIYATMANGISQHYHIEALPNGNILCVATDRYASTLMEAEGRNTGNMLNNFRLERILELEPVGTNQANISWEWKFIDHLIQDFDVSKNNFGVVADTILNIPYESVYLLKFPKGMQF